MTARPPTHIAVSFCRVIPGSPVLGLLALATREMKVVDFPDRLSGLGGLTGLAQAGRHLYAVTSGSERAADAPEVPGPSLLLVFDGDDLSLLNEYRCRTVFDAHSVWATSDALYVVSTGTDAVVRLGLRGPEVVSEEVYWRPSQEGLSSDVHHLNAIHGWGSSLLVSGFGLKAGPQWSSARDGFIVNLSTGERVVTGLCHPHSLAEVDGALAFCESSSMTLRFLGSERRQPLPGYARGLCRVGSQLFAGSSKGRRVSKSTGALTTRHDAGGDLEGHCSITIFMADTLAVEHVVDLDAYGAELYDLLPVYAAERWPVSLEVAWRDAALRGLRSSFDTRDATISSLHVEMTERDRTIKWLHQEVAKRDQAITWLHGEVAKRDEAPARGREAREQRDEPPTD